MITRTCETCGYEGRYTKPGFAAHHFPRHSCARELARRNRPGRYAPPGEVRDCDCPGQPHKHGELSTYNQHKCRCEPCRAKSRNTAAKNTRLKAYGRSPFTDAEPARQHIAKLRADGMGLQRIADLSGVARTILCGLIWGSPSEGVKPTKRLRRDNAARILAVELDVDPRTTVDGTGTTRRLQALAAIGWSAPLISDRTGICIDQIRRLTRGQQRPQRSTAEAIAAAYDEMWKEQPPQATTARRIVVRRARNDAERKGWVGPLAWEDDTIDDPDAEPFRPRQLRAKEADPARRHVDEVLVQRALSGVRVEANPREREEIVRRWRDAGRRLVDLERIQEWSIRQGAPRRKEAAA